jgi:preprotein translocase subunit SecE
MAKTRAQRKAERRAREAREQQQGGGAQQEQTERAAESRAQHDTQVPVSGDIAEIEAVEQTGARLDELESAAPAESAPPAESLAPEDLEAPAPSRADEPPPAKPSRRERAEEKRLQKTQEREEDRRQKAQEKAREKAPAKRDKAQVEERRRGGVTGFIASCWAELKRVQWPDRETLIQASAVTLVFVAVAAAYLGALDAVFSWLVKRVL